MLYVIVPYFNFEDNILREKNIYKFIDKYLLIHNIKIVISEAFTNKSLSKLKDLDKKVFKHLKFLTSQKLWIKENLINLAIKQLPEEAKYVAWIDGDIEFKNLNWVNETLHKLNQYDILQLFENVIHLNEFNQEIEKNYIEKNIILSKYGQPGFAWAFKKSTLDKIGGLFELDIVGMGDNFMGRCFKNTIPFINPSLKNKIKTLNSIIPTSIGYYNSLSSYYDKCKDLNLSYIKGDIKHFWHGDLNRRLYLERWKILEECNYDPNIHIIKNEHGLIQIDDIYVDLLKNLDEYFNIREKNFSAKD